MKSYVKLTGIHILRRKKEIKMSLMDALSAAIANPNQVGSADQMGSILNMVQGIAGSQNLDSGNTSALMSAVGSVVRTTLQNQQAQSGSSGVEAMIAQLAGSGNGAQAVQTLFGGQEQQIAQTIAQRTGMDANQIMGLLPMVLPVVLQLLNQVQQQGGATGANSVLNTFLDGDRDGDVDMGDVLSQVGRFLR
jgi:hypothetical protein